MKRSERCNLDNYVSTRESEYRQLNTNTPTSESNWKHGDWWMQVEACGNDDGKVIAARFSNYVGEGEAFSEI
ncbi:hypothetical protein ACE1AT_25255 [Pelatocladus sp. BLCC-F211]|uniref:hypothetical protein n=1 Tax=Pelatocladus sp. BLCC-F211 TaxID=3342752 RepID=UPI0035B977B5